MSPYVLPLGGQVATVDHRQPVIGQDGKPERDARGKVVTEVVSTDVPGCSVQPLTTQETLGAADQIKTRWRLIGPVTDALSAATATDAVTVDGITYEVDGDPQPWRDLWGNPDHIEIYLRRDVPQGT